MSKSTSEGGGSIVTNGLTTYLDLANPMSYISGSPTVTDLSGNRYVGTISGGPQYNFQNFPYMS